MLNFSIISLLTVLNNFILLSVITVVVNDINSITLKLDNPNFSLEMVYVYKRNSKLSKVHVKLCYFSIFTLNFFSFVISLNKIKITEGICRF